MPELFPSPYQALLAEYTARNMAALLSYPRPHGTDLDSLAETAKRAAEATLDALGLVNPDTRPG